MKNCPNLNVNTLEFQVFYYKTWFYFAFIMINLIHVLYIVYYHIVLKKIYLKIIGFRREIKNTFWTDFKTGIKTACACGKTGIILFMNGSFVLEPSYYCSLGTNSVYNRTKYSTLIRMDMYWSWGVCSSTLFSNYFNNTYKCLGRMCSWERSKPSVLTSDDESLSPKVT